MSTETLAAPETERSPNKASVEFFFSSHSPENLSKIVDALVASDSDIIAIEKIREGTLAWGLR